jgi:hypothetical protein
MLTLLTTEDFSAWFRALGDADAEEVATALELMQEVLPEREPPASRDLLLWFQSSTGVRWVDERFDDDFFEFSRRVHQLVEHLASKSVQLRLRETDAERAGAAIEAIMKQARLQRRHARIPGSPRRTLQDVELEYRALLSSLGIAEPARSEPNSSLRELNIRAREPNIRVFYGVDRANDRALLVLGEHLDRTAYGPSVRKALRLWREFLSSTETTAREHRP